MTSPDADVSRRRRSRSCAARARACGTTTATRYLDFLSGLAVTGLGHAHPAVADALAEQAAHAAARLEPVRHRAGRGGRGHARPPPRAAAGQVFFCNSGAEANECAHQARPQVRRPRPARRGVSAYGSFHGRTLATLHATGQPQKHEPFQPLPEGFRHVAWDDLDALESGARPVGRRRAARARAGRGRREPGDRRVLPGGAPAVRRAGHRCSWSTRCRPASAAPAGGSASSTSASCPTSSPWPRRSATACPSARAGRGRDVAAAFEPGDHATTYGGQPLATAAARAVLGEMERLDVAGPRRRGPASASPTALAGAAGRRPPCGGSACCSPPSSPTASTPRTVAADALDAGLVVNAVTPTALRLAPPLTVSDDEIDEAVDDPRQGARRAAHDGTSSRSTTCRRPSSSTSSTAPSADPPQVLAGQGRRAALREAVAAHPPLDARWRSCSSAATRSSFRADEVGVDTPRDRRRHRPRARRLPRRRSAPGCSTTPTSRRMAARRRHPDREPALRPRPPVPGARRPAHHAPGVRRRSPAAPCAWVGDFNNVARSLALGAALSGMHIRLACPPGYGPTEADLDRLRARAPADVVRHDRPDEAAKGADAVHTDVWTSMGFEAEADGARPRLRGLHGRRRGDGGGRARRACSCTACPRTAARRWRRR